MRSNRGISNRTDLYAGATRSVPNILEGARFRRFADQDPGEHHRHPLGRRGRPIHVHLPDRTGREDWLVEAIFAEKKRLRRADHEIVRAILEREVKRIESALEDAVTGDEVTPATSATLKSIPGAGKPTGKLMAIELPELGRLDDPRIELLTASLT